MIRFSTNCEIDKVVGNDPYNYIVVISSICTYMQPNLLEYVLQKVDRVCVSLVQTAKFMLLTTCKEGVGECLDRLLMFGWIPETYDFQIASVHANALVMKWLIKHGVILPKRVPHSRYEVRPDDFRRALELYHEYNIPGEYQKLCKTGECKVCNLEVVKEMWVMDVREYTNSIQWLPHEMLVDIIGLCK